MKVRSILLAGAAVLLILALAASVDPRLALGSADQKQQKEDGTEIVYVPTPQSVVDKMLDMVKCTGKDVVFDLGCGDGRIVATAAKKYGARGIGIDLDPDRIKDSKETFKKFGVKEGKGYGEEKLRMGNALKVPDLGDATVVTLYMLPKFMELLEPIAKKTLKPGTRIVAHDFGFPNWKEDQRIEFKGPEREHTLFLWIVKEDKGAQKNEKEKK